MKSWIWTDRRLTSWYCRLNALYWYNRLPNYRVLSGKTGCRFAGFCDRRRRKIVIDTKGRTNGDVRDLLLHEMAHVAETQRHDSYGLFHGLPFWVQVERLLRLGVRFSVAGALNEFKYWPPRLPARLRHCRRAIRRAPESWAPWWSRGYPRENIPDSEVLTAFRLGKRTYGNSWTRTLWRVGAAYGLITLEGVPTNDKDAALIALARKRYFK